jgi:hypothetical protein
MYSSLPAAGRCERVEVKFLLPTRPLNIAFMAKKKCTDTGSKRVILILILGI